MHFKKPVTCYARVAVVIRPLRIGRKYSERLKEDIREMSQGKRNNIGKNYIKNRQ